MSMLFQPSPHRIYTKKISKFDDDVYKYDKRYKKKKDWSFRVATWACSWCIPCMLSDLGAGRNDWIDILHMPKYLRKKYNIHFKHAVHGMQLTKGPRYCRTDKSFH